MRILTPAAFSFFLLIQSTLSILAILTIQPVPALAESAESFKTEEYRESNALDIINAADAYALGYTGLGQTVGVLDSPVRVDHPELADKAETIDVPADWEHITHGTHVAGIIAARRDGIGMHGVAFDAGIWAGPLLDIDDDLDLEEYFASHPEVRIFNNSWGDPDTGIQLNIQGQWEIGSEDFLERFFLTDPWYMSIATYADEHPESVFVFAAGNEGQIAPAIPAIAPRYLGQGYMANWISVGAINANNGCITRGEDGRLILNPASIPMFTNLATGSELYTIMAPGSEINSLNAADNGYMMESGTSMAAPVVSGALALVAQAYPWMTGKQLADSVLTTANRDFEAPPYTVLYTTPPENKESNLVETVRLVIIAKDKKEADQIWKNGSTTIEAGGKTYTVNLKNPDIDTIKALVQNHIDLDEKAWLVFCS